MRLRTMLPGAMLVVTAGLMLATPASAQVTKFRSNPKSLILDGAKVSAGSDLLYLSGQLAAPLVPGKPLSAASTIEDYGDTKTQAISALNKIKALLEAQGYKMSDLIKLTLFIAPDPKLGKLDFAGANAGFKQFFDTPENPTTVARSAFQVAALAAPQFLIEIEAIAAKPHAPEQKN